MKNCQIGRYPKEIQSGFKGNFNEHLVVKISDNEFVSFGGRETHHLMRVIYDDKTEAVLFQNSPNFIFNNIDLIIGTPPYNLCFQTI